MFVRIENSIEAFERLHFNADTVIALRMVLVSLSSLAFLSSMESTCRFSPGNELSQPVSSMASLEGQSTLNVDNNGDMI